MTCTRRTAGSTASSTELASSRTNWSATSGSIRLSVSWRPRCGARWSWRRSCARTQPAAVARARPPEAGIGTQRISPALPLLTVANVVSPMTERSLEIVRTLDPEHDLYLQDHRLDGRPVLPFAVALELMAEVA